LSRQLKDINDKIIDDNNKNVLKFLDMGLSEKDLMTEKGKIMSNRDDVKRK
jgi:hypothetical protein